MPNGKGFLDCRYCVFAWPQDNSSALLFGSPTRCLFHQRDLAAPTGPGNHRFCIHFQPNALFFGESRLHAFFWPIAKQFARFGAELDPGVLYEYGAPSARQIPKPVKALQVLRIPDYQNLTWKPAD